MTGLIAIETPVGSGADPLPPELGQLGSLPFWPVIDMADLRAAARLDSTVSPARLVHAAQMAVLWVNRELSAWRQQQLAQGIERLADVPGDMVGGDTERVLLYRRAVYAETEANARERYRGLDTTGKGQAAAEREEQPIDDLRRDARWAIRDFLGQARSTVELI